MWKYLLALVMIFPKRLFLYELAIKGPKAPTTYGGMKPETQQGSAQTTALYPPHNVSDFRINALIIPTLKSMLKKKNGFCQIEEKETEKSFPVWTDMSMPERQLGLVSTELSTVTVNPGSV